MWIGIDWIGLWAGLPMSCRARAGMDRRVFSSPTKIIQQGYGATGSTATTTGGGKKKKGHGHGHGGHGHGSSSSSGGKHANAVVQGVEGADFGLQV